MKIVKGFKLLTIFTESSIIDYRLGSKCGFVNSTEKYPRSHKCCRLTLTL